MNDTQQSPDEQTAVPGPLKWLETLGITLVFLAFSVWHRPEDPFFLEGNFPWSVLAPLLAGLRYGFLMALVSALVILASLGFHQGAGPGTPAEGFPYVWAVGVLGISLLAGEFRDYWDRQRQKLQASNDYRGSRLEEFTRNYYLLKVSHDRLEQQLAGSSNSLREALRRLYTDLGELPEVGLNRDSATLMLQLLVRYGQLQVAGIFAMTEGRIDDKPLATVGRFRNVNPKDPLLEHALAERRLVSIQTEFRKRLDELSTDLLAVIPLIDSDDHLVGVCVIEAMPFFSFETRTLRLLNIMGGHMADMMREQAGSRSTSNAQWRHFRHHLARVGSDADTFNLPGAMLGLVLPDDVNGKRVADHIQKARRGLDVVAEHRAGAMLYILVLTPLTDELGLAGYLQRLDDGVREAHGAHLNELATVTTLQITDRAQAQAWLDEFFGLTERSGQ